MVVLTDEEQAVLDIESERMRAMSNARTAEQKTGGRNGGRTPKGTRCPCGTMSVARAKLRAHHCTREGWIRKRIVGPDGKKMWLEPRKAQ